MSLKKEGPDLKSVFSGIQGTLAKKFIVKTLDSVKKQRESRNTVRKTSFGLHRPWSTHLAAIKALMSKRSYYFDEDRVAFELSERDDRVKSVVSGFLVIHVLEIFKVFVTSKSYLPGVPLCLYLVAKAGNNLRTSTVYSAHNLGRIRIDCAFHLPIEISEWRDSPANIIRIEVWGFQDPEAHFLIGKIKQQVYQYIKDTHGIHRKPLLAEDTLTGKMVYEFAFAYGCFGYGHSNQITNPDCPVNEAVVHSMFPRIAPDGDDNITNKFAIRTPKRLHMMSILSFVQDMPTQGIVTTDGRKIEAARLQEPKRIVIQKVDYEEGAPLHAYINLNIWQTPIQADFNDAYGDFLCITHRKDRLKFVSEMSNGKKVHFREMEAGAIFESMDDEVVEKIMKSERHTGTLIYPDEFPCPESNSVTLDKSDEAFMSKFPAAVRTTGYLGAVFGLRTQDPPTINNDMNFPAYLDAGKTRSGGFYGCRVFCFSIRDFCRHICKCVQTCWRFFFPDTIMYDSGRPVPQVALSLHSPTDSTVNLYAYFVRPEEEVEHGNQTIQEIAKKSAALSELENEDAVCYGDILGMDAIQSEITTASIKKSMAEAHIVV